LVIAILKLRVLQPQVYRPRRKWNYKIKMDIKETGCDGMDWIQQTQERGKW